MIALLQRVTGATLRIEGEVRAETGRGLVVLLGLEKDDDLAVGEKLLRRVLDYRVFPDAEGRMNCSLRDVDGDLLLVSQFTLAADTRKGRRPGFSTAMPPDEAEALYDRLVASIGSEFGNLQTGEFAADMKIALENDGPVTFSLHS